MKHSIYIKNFVATTLIVLASFVVLGSLSLTWSYRRALTEKRDTMTDALREAARYISVQSLDAGFDLEGLDISMWLSMIAGVSGFDLLITDPDGVIVSCSDRRLIHLGVTVPQSALRHASQQGQDQGGRGAVVLTTLGQVYAVPRHVTGLPLTMVTDGESAVFGYLFLSSDADAFRRQWQNFSGIFTMISISVMAMTFIISFVLTKKQAEPIKEIATTARRFARGDFEARVEDVGRIDEIGELTQAFNAMADSLESSETHRREFIANVSHELKTPMTVIAGFADGILDGTIPPESAPRYLRIISSETHRLSRLVKSMLDVSKLQSADAEALKTGSFDIAEVVRLGLLSLGGKIEAGRLGVRANLPEERVMTRGDKDSITQVVYNLIDNAIKFSKPGGTISLDLWKQGGRAYVSIENQGETIPPDELPHIFDRFHKADKSRSADREGIGLGLYIVKSILDNHNEDIFVTSANGVTKFVFTLTIV